MPKLKTTLMAATILSAPFVLAPVERAQAQPVSGLYVGAGAGLNIMQSQMQSATTAPFSMCGEGGCFSSTVHGNARANARLGFAGVVSAGYGFGNGLRAELEGGWRENRQHGNVGDTAARVNIKGDATYAISGEGGGLRGRSSQYSAMVNLLYDLNIGANWVYPYIGAGAGYAWQRFSGLSAGRNGFVLDPGISGIGWGSGDTTGGSFAYQAIAGAAFPIDMVPGLSITAEYRFMGALSKSISVHGGGGACVSDGVVDDCNGNGVSRANVAAAYNHSIMLGVRYAFNAAPAAVMAAPAVAPAGKSFLVFFDWDKSTLSDRARGIIRDAAATSKTTAHTRIEVNGYADTSGTPQYNQGLSMRRAQAVAAELVRDGVAKQEIAIKAFGDTVLLVPTGPGVREPQNRRVEIIIR